jgi:hypothetical protein
VFDLGPYIPMNLILFFPLLEIIKVVNEFNLVLGIKN